jgi:glycoprotein endo-alpha-1,2-mannosidase
MLSRIVIIGVVIFSFFGSAFAGDVQWNGTFSRLWDVADNWDLNRVPDTGDRAILANTPGPIIDSNTTAAVDTVTIGGSGGTLDVNGGTLTASGSTAGIDIGYDAGTNGTLTINGGTVTSNSDAYVGFNGTGTININAGTLNINGTLNIAYNSDTTVGQVNIHGGTLNCTDLIMAPWDGTAGIDITEGTLIVDGNKISTINSYVNLTGWITAYGGSGSVVFDYNVTNLGKTTVTISKAAKKPDPGNNPMDIAVDRVLHWTAAPDIASYDVYFGTDTNAVRDAGRLAGDLDGDGWVDYNDIGILASCWLKDPAGSQPYAGVNDDNFVDFADYAPLANNWMAQASPIFKGTRDTNSFDPNLASYTTYYWRVDTVKSGQKWKGNVWNFTTIDSNYSLVGKVMCGYQGWFNCTGDGANRSWVHWPRSGSNAPTPSNVHVDLWPDMTEMDANEMFAATGFNDGNGTHYLFSSHNVKTVRRHFKWMQDYGIDGVYLQRFATEIKDRGSSSFAHRNDVLDYCKDGANMYGRKYAVMYDLSGLNAGETSFVISDWKYLVDTKHITTDPNYMHHRGRPVVAVWGIGFNDGRQYTLAECLALVDFLRNDPVYGGNAVVVGVPSYWRTHDGSHDCLNDPCVATIVKVADIVSPWSVGRYNNTSGVSNYASDVWIQDVTWCQQNSTPSHPIEYLPVIFPGYSYHNATATSNPPKKINEIPRWGGQFLWDQVYYSTGAGVNMYYIAMFDEADEGTAIFKVTNSPPAGAPFVTYRQDLPGQGKNYLPAGAALPNDEYLWLTGQAGRAIRSEIPRTSTRPARP